MFTLHSVKRDNHNMAARPGHYFQRIPKTKKFIYLFIFHCKVKGLFGFIYKEFTT